MNYFPSDSNMSFNEREVLGPQRGSNKACHKACLLGGGAGRGPEPAETGGLALALRAGDLLPASATLQCHCLGFLSIARFRGLGFCLLAGSRVRQHTIVIGL